MRSDRITAISRSEAVFGSKIAPVCNGRIVAYLRDDFPEIQNPGEWDLPGGEREADETALFCALREMREEFGVAVPPASIVHADTFFKYQPHRIVGAFFVAEIPPRLIDAIVFGDEGQYWEMMPVDTFIRHPNAVRELQGALALWWEGLG